MDRTVIERLADTYRQLYVAPAPDATEKYLDIVEKGHEPQTRDLSHFITSSRDSITIEQTPAGDVTVITLGNREDFVTFLRIMANRCRIVDIPATQGSSTLIGVINRRKFEQHLPYKDTLIVLSIGPYSAVPAEKLGLSYEEWLALSGDIRKYHECTHFICRRLFPDKKDPVWDELVADAVGIVAAFGRYDVEKSKVFLGIEGNAYGHGRLENYADIDPNLIGKVSEALGCIADIIADHPDAAPYEIAVMLEEEKDRIWK